MQRGVVYLLAELPWSYFGSFTFSSERSPKVRMTMAFALLRKFGEWHGWHFKSFPWVIREERGEKFGRWHFHVLFGRPPSRSNPSRDRVRYLLEGCWEGLGGGIARVRVFDSTLTGVDYMCKGLGDAFEAGGNRYELSKFGTLPDGGRLVVAEAAWSEIARLRSVSSAGVLP